MWQDFFFLNSILIGYLLPLSLIGMGIRQCYIMTQDENATPKGETREDSNGFSSEERSADSDEDMSTAESRSCSEEGESSSDEGNNDLKEVLGRLDLNCRNLLQTLPLSPFDRNSINSLTQSIIYSPDFVSVITKRTRNSQQLTEAIVEASANYFSPEEQAYIKKVTGSGQEGLKAMAAALLKNPSPS